MQFYTHSSPHTKLPPEAPSLYYHRSQIHTKADLRLWDNSPLAKSKILRVSPNAQLLCALMRSVLYLPDNSVNENV